ncbi:MAG TPA: anti-phage BREX system Lon protease BrxL [Alphaproteobacteria bacterium]|nr:anti-phage BREX system Lon protease BrxL [Alphaproteobacteria bacterium]
MELGLNVSTGEEIKPMRLDAKILEHLSDRVILKPLTRWNEAYKEFPRYVMEYLCARFVDPKEPLPGQRKIDRILEEHYVESGKKELIKSRIREQGEYTFPGQLTLSYDQRTDHYWADVPALGDNHVRLSEPSSVVAALPPSCNPRALFEQARVAPSPPFPSLLPSPQGEGI